MDDLMRPVSAASAAVEPSTMEAWRSAIDAVRPAVVGSSEPVAVEAVEDNPLAVTPDDDMANFGITPVMVMNEFLPVQIVGERAHQDSGPAVVGKPSEPEADGEGVDPSGKLVDLLRPLVFGQVTGGRGGGGFGAMQSALGAVRATGLKIPAMGSMLGEVGGALSAAGAGAGGGAMAGLVGGAGGAVTAAGGAMAAIGPVGIALAGVASAGALATVAMEKYADVLTGAAENLAEFSPELQVAYDMDAIRTEMNQLQRGARFGDQLGSFVETKGEFGRATTAVWDEMLAAMLDIWTAAEPQVKEIVQWVKIAAEIIGDMREFSKSNPVFKGMAEMIRIQAEISAMIRKWFSWMEDKEEFKDDPLVDSLFDYARERLGPTPMFGPPWPLGV
jgi:hypothetical protein